MPTWTLADVEKELLDTASFIAHRKAASQSSTSSDLELTLIKGIIAKINSLHLTAGQSLTLYKTLDEQCSAFSQEMKDQVKASIDAGMAQPVVDPSSQTSLKPQLVPLAQYLTKKDWEFIYSGASHHEKVKVCTSRLSMLGVKSMHEQTVGHVVGCLLCPYKALPIPPEIYKIALDTKLAFQPSVASLPYVRHYPDDPRTLPAAILTAAYPCQEGPAGHIPAQFTMVHAEVILRSSHKKLKQYQAAQGKVVPVQDQPSSGSNGSNGVSMNELMTCMLSFANNMATMQQKQQQHQQVHDMHKETHGSSNSMASGVRLALCDGSIATPPDKAKQFEPKLSAPQTVPNTPAEPQSQPTLPITQPQQSQEQSTPQVQQPPQEHSAAEVEDAAFNALKNRSLDKTKASTKASAKGKAKAKAKGQAKAKAKANAQAQQSAGSNKRPLPEYEISKPEDRWDGKYDSWCSKHYHKARGIAAQMGYEDEEAKEYGKKARAQATVLYNQAFRAWIYWV